MGTVDAYHGLSAYRGARDPGGALVAGLQLIQCPRPGHICGADRPLGPIGLRLAGACSVAWAADVWSEEAAGQRQATQKKTVRVRRPSDTQWRELAAGAVEYDHERYAECWLDAESLGVVCVWAREDAPEWHTAARELADRLGVPLRMLSGRERVWSVSDIPDPDRWADLSRMPWDRHVFEGGCPTLTTLEDMHWYAVRAGIIGHMPLAAAVAAHADRVQALRAAWFEGQ